MPDHPRGPDPSGPRDAETDRAGVREVRLTDEQLALLVGRSVGAGRRSAAAALLLAFLLGAAATAAVGPARAFFGGGGGSGVVYDPANHATALSTLASAASTLTQVAQTLQMVTLVVRAMGDPGAIIDLVAVAGDSGLFGDVPQETRDQVREVAQAGRETFKAAAGVTRAALNVSRSASNLNASIGQTTAFWGGRPFFALTQRLAPTAGELADAVASRNAARTAFAFDQTVQVTDVAIHREEVRARRRAELYQSALDGLGLSWHHQLRSAESARRADELQSAAMSAENAQERQAVQALAVIQNTEAVEAQTNLLAALARMMAAQTLVRDLDQPLPAEDDPLPANEVERYFALEQSAEALSIPCPEGKSGRAVCRPTPADAPAGEQAGARRDGTR
jgi:hypothetical protein